MPGRTGKRAKPPTNCVDCGGSLAGRDFYRDGKKDRCQGCFEKHLAIKYPKTKD